MTEDIKNVKRTGGHELMFCLWEFKLSWMIPLYPFQVSCILCKASCTEKLDKYLIAYWNQPQISIKRTAQLRKTTKLLWKGRQIDF